MNLTSRILALVCLVGLSVSPVQAQTPEAAPSPEPAVTQSAEQQAREELRKGIELNKQGYTESAIVSLRKAIELDPGLVEAYSELGTILLASRNTAYAITIYSKLSELEPQKAEWKEILMELQSTYDQPRAAAITGEELLKLRPNDVALMEKLAELYRRNDLDQERARMLERMALAKASDPKPYWEAGRAYYDVGDVKAAIRVLEKAAKLDPKNLEIQAMLADLYTQAGDYDASEELLTRLQAENPQALGLKDKMTDLYVARGDHALSREGYMAARDWYLKAKEMAPSGGSLATSLDERIKKAEDLRGPYFDNFYEYTSFAGNFGNRVINRLSIPVSDSDLYVQGWHDYRSVSTNNPGVGTAERTFGKLGLEYRAVDMDAIFTGWYGTEGLFRVGGRYDGPNVQGGFWLVRDMNYDTPFALANGLKYFGQEGFLDGQINEWIGIGGNFLNANYIDNSHQFIYNIGPYFTVMRQEDVYDWVVSYTHGGNANSPAQNILDRFGPADFQADSIGTRFTHTPTDRWRYYLGFYQSFFNDTTSGQTYQVGTDVKFTETSFFRVDYEYGAAPFGRIPLTGGIVNNNNQSLRTQLHIQF